MNIGKFCENFILIPDEGMKYRNYFVNRKSYREFYEIFVINMLEIKYTKIVLFELYDELFIVNCSIIIVSRYRIFCARDYLDYEKLSDFHDLHLSFLSFISILFIHGNLFSSDPLIECFRIYFKGKYYPCFPSSSFLKLVSRVSLQYSLLTHCS